MKAVLALENSTSVALDIFDPCNWNCLAKALPDVPDAPAKGPVNPCEKPAVTITAALNVDCAHLCKRRLNENLLCLSFSY